jgi:hypothetical protein
MNKLAKRISHSIRISTYTLPRRIRIALIVGIGDVYVRVNDRYIVLVVAVETSDPGLELGHWIGNFVVSEIAVQVIDVQVVPVAGQQRGRVMDGLARGLVMTNQTHCHFR